MLYARHAKRKEKQGRKEKIQQIGNPGPRRPFGSPVRGKPPALRSFCGNVREKTQAVALIGGVTAERLLADTGQDSDAIFEQAAGQGMSSLIVPRGRRKGQCGGQGALQGQAPDSTLGRT